MLSVHSHARLHTVLPACLPGCWPARQAARSEARLPACLPACQFVLTCLEVRGVQVAHGAHDPRGHMRLPATLLGHAKVSDHRVKVLRGMEGEMG